AVNVGISVSRVGSSAQTKAMKKVAGKLRLELAQFRELAAFAQFGQDLDEATRRKIERGQRLTELLKQAQFAAVPFEEQVVVIFAAVQGLLDAVPVAEVKRFESELVTFLRERHSNILENVRMSGELTAPLEEELKAVIVDFSSHFFKLQTTNY
ncbi:MAG: F-type H+-transporting ATPase subunit alpha, partial [Parcubacteria group bacterium Gr01-1014_72]